MGVPVYGSKRDELPAAEVLGTVNVSPIVAAPPSASWTNPGSGVTITLDEPLPPWELEDTEYSSSDARRYVDAPPNVVLRWINPRLLESLGWRDWEPVLTGDQRFHCKVKQMAAPDGNIRRGGTTGDILGWMYRSWYESRKKQHMTEIQQQSQSAVNKQQELVEDARRGQFGPYIRLEDAKHPTHTQFDGRGVRD